MTAMDERYRIQVDVSEDLYNRTKNNFPWGLRNTVMTKILEQLNQSIESHGIVVAYAIASDNLTLFGGLKDESIRIVKVNRPEVDQRDDGRGTYLPLTSNAGEKKNSTSERIYGCEGEE